MQASGEGQEAEPRSPGCGGGGAGSGFHWLRLAETRMSTGLRGARECALC